MTLKTISQSGFFSSVSKSTGLVNLKSLGQLIKVHRKCLNILKQKLLPLLFVLLLFTWKQLRLRKTHREVGDCYQGLSKIFNHYNSEKS